MYEFRIKSSSNLSFTHDKNNGQGSVYIGMTGPRPMKTGTSHPGFYKFSNKGRQAMKGNQLSFTEPDPVAFTQYDWLAPNIYNN